MTLRDVLAPLAVVTLLFGGYFKTLPFVTSLPVDLTVIAAAAVALAVIGRALTGDGGLSSKAVGAGIALIAVIGFGLTWPASSDYAVTKRVALLLIVLGMLGAGMLVRTAERQRVWVWLHVGVGVLLVLTATVDTAGRLGVNTIAAGRASGVAVVVLMVLVLMGGAPGVVRKVVPLALAVWLAKALIETGSRGPVLAAAAAVLVVIAVSPGGRNRGRRLVVVGAALWLGYHLLTTQASVGAARIQGYLSGDVTDQARAMMWHASARELPHSALVGVGWGNFWQVLEPHELLDSGFRQYPHNVILEVGIEAGWLPALVVVCFLVAGLVRLRRAATSPYGAALFAIAVFFVINAMVSGDVSDNRMMWAAVVMGWVVVGTTKAPARPVRAERGLVDARAPLTNW